MKSKIVNIRLHQHDLADYLQCPRRYDLAVNKHIHPISRNRAINVGDMLAKSVYWLHAGRPVEECMAHVYKVSDDLKKGLYIQSNIDEVENDEAMVIAMISGYNEKYIVNDSSPAIGIKKIIPEYHIELPVNIGNYHFTFVCRLDGKIETVDFPYILEIKTASQLNKASFLELNTNFQINTYWFAAVKQEKQPFKGVVYRWIIKTKIRQKKSETIDMFQRRIVMEYQEKQSDYFIQEEMNFNQSVIKEFEKDFMFYMNELTRSYLLNSWVKRGVACRTKFGNCKYLRYCSEPTEEVLNTFYRIDEKEEGGEKEDESV